MYLWFNYLLNITESLFIYIDINHDFLCNIHSKVRVKNFNFISKVGFHNNMFL